MKTVCCANTKKDRHVAITEKFGGVEPLSTLTQYLARFSETVIKWKIYTDKDLFSNAVLGVDNNSRPLQAVPLALALGRTNGRTAM